MTVGTAPAPTRRDDAWSLAVRAGRDNHEPADPRGLERLDGAVDEGAVRDPDEPS